VGHSPGAMAASANPAYLFVAHPKSGNVSVLDIDSRKLIAVAAVGANPNYIAITPDGNYALVLNETSGDMAVIRTGSIVQAASERWRSRRGALFMMVPLGSKPVSAAVMPV
jgi:DNA-binding beta-propeller fold protein YncE